MVSFQPSVFFDLSRTRAQSLFLSVENVWEVFPLLGGFILEIGPALPEDFELRGEGVWIARTAKIAAAAAIEGPAIIGRDTEIRHGAYIRANVLVGDGAVVGNSSEIKNAILCDGAQAPHFNYVGDSVLGYLSHIGAGVVLSNFKLDHGLVVVKDGETILDTGLQKFGAVLGDRVEVGCNSVLNPGTLIGMDSAVYPLSFVRGTVPANSIVKRDGTIISKRQ